MANLPTFDHNPDDCTVTVVHPDYDIRTYAAVRSEQLGALLAVLASCSLESSDPDLVTVQWLAEGLAREVSGLVAMFTRTDCLEAIHE